MKKKYISNITDCAGLYNGFFRDAKPETKKSVVKMQQAEITLEDSLIESGAIPDVSVFLGRCRTGFGNGTRAHSYG